MSEEKGDTMDTITKMTAYGRVPAGEPGYDFPRGKDGPLAPMQKGTVIAEQQRGIVTEYAVPPAWMQSCEDSDLTLYSVASVFGDDDKLIDHVCFGTRSGVLFAWFVQSDEVYQGDAAEAVMHDGFAWQRMLSHIPWIQEACRDLRRRLGTMFPEQEWAVVWIDEKGSYSFDGTKGMVKRFCVRDDKEG